MIYKRAALSMMTTVMLFSTVCQANSIASSYTPEQTNVFSNRIKQDVEFQAKLKAFQEQELASLASATSLDEASIDKNQKEIG